MPTTISGTDGVSAVVDGTIVAADIASGAVTQAKLAQNVAGNGPIFRAEVSSATAVADNTWTKINVQSEVFDSNSNFASSRFTPTVAGYYFINGSVDASGAAKLLTAGLYKNGTVRFATGDHHDTTTAWISNVSGTLYLNGTTDYIELWAYHNNGNSRNIGTDFNRTFLEGFLVRAA